MKKVSEVKDYKWYKTIPIGKLAMMKERVSGVWCPKCGGRGREQKRGLLSSKVVTCGRCHGRTFVAARKITEAEYKKLSFNEQQIVRSVRQYPGRR